MEAMLESQDLVLFWKIENFSQQKGRLESPHFYYYRAEWYVEIYLKDMCLSGDQIKINFCLVSDYTIQANWSCAFRNSKGVLLKLIVKFKEEFRGKSCAWTWNLNCKDVFDLSNLPDDILTVEIRIWDHQLSHFLPKIESKNLPQADRVVIKKMFVLNIPVENIRTKYTVNHVEQILRDEGVTITLYREQNKNIIIILERPKSTFTPKHKIFLITNQENCVQFKEDQFRTNNSRYIFYFDYDHAKELSLQGGYAIKNFRFLFVCTYHTNPVVGISAINCRPISNHIANRNDQQPLLLNTHRSVSEDLRSMYKEGFMSDFSLRVQDKTFQVHKNILGARSSVFRAMFTTDMKEKDSGSVDIPDVDIDTIQRMLKFVYWDEVDKNMQWESACSLYSAADKYALESLKQRCSSYLRANLSATSVIGVLLLSDTHQDRILKAAALDFISGHDKEIKEIDTERWRKFTEDHGPLSLEILQQLYMKKMAA